VKITIDTKEDSHAEIQKVIKMLSSLVSGEEIMSNRGNIFDLDNATDTNQKNSDIFGDDSSNINDSSSNSDSSSSDSGGSSEGSGGGIFNMFDSGSGSDDSPKIAPKEASEDEKKENDELDIDLPDVEEYR